jgi:hypothetical protein
MYCLRYRDGLWNAAYRRERFKYQKHGSFVGKVQGYIPTCTTAKGLCSPTTVIVGLPNNKAPPKGIR